MRASGYSALGLFFVLFGCEGDSTSPHFTAEEPFTHGSEVTTQTSFRLEGINGECKLAGSPSASSVTATGFRRVTADTQDKADSRLPDIQVTMTAGTDEILLKTDHPRSGSEWTYVVDYAIVVPQDMSVTILNANGQVNVDSLAGGVVVTTGNGEIEARSVVGDMSLNAGNGGGLGQVILLSGSTVQINTGNGNIELRVPASTSALVDAATGTGRITLSGLSVSEKVQSQSSLTGRLGTGDGSIVLRAGNGNIALLGT